MEVENEKESENPPEEVEKMEIIPIEDEAVNETKIPTVDDELQKKSINQSPEVIDIDSNSNKEIVTPRTESAESKSEESVRFEKEPTEEIEVTEVKKSATPIRNPYQASNTKSPTPSAWANKTSLQSALKGEKLIVTTGKKIIRIRARVSANQKDANELSLCTEILRLLKLVKSYIEKIDDNAGIIKWNTTDVKTKELAANNLEAETMSPHVARSYVGIQPGRRSLGTVKNELGFQIVTDLTLEQFIDIGGSLRKEKDWIFLQPAEMQKSPNAYAIGFCAASECW